MEWRETPERSSGVIIREELAHDPVVMDGD